MGARTHSSAIRNEANCAEISLDGRGYAAFFSKVKARFSVGNVFVLRRENRSLMVTALTIKVARANPDRVKWFSLDGPNRPASGVRNTHRPECKLKPAGAAPSDSEPH
jgi:hypothetical protein